MHHLAAPPRRERAKHEDLADLRRSSTARLAPMGTLAAKAKEALQVGIGGDQVQRGRAAVVDVLGHAVTVADQFQIGRLAFIQAMAASAQALCKGTVSEPTNTAYLPGPGIFFRQQLGMRLAKALWPRPVQSPSRRSSGPGLHAPAP